MQRCAFVLFLGISACGSVIDVGAGDKNNGNGSSTSPTAVGAPTALDGVWDITSAGDVASAEMTIAGGSAHGVIIDAREGTSYQYAIGGTSEASIYAKCHVEKSRIEFSFVATGNALSATHRSVRMETGENCPSYNNHDKTITLSGVRTREAPASATDLNGDWQVTGEGIEFTGTLNGTVLTGHGNAEHEKGGMLTVAVAGNLFTVSSSDRDVSFAARKRE